MCYNVAALLQFGAIEEDADKFEGVDQRSSHWNEKSVMFNFSRCKFLANQVNSR